MRQKLIQHFLVLILLIPLLFINVKNNHDWGDDFAQYIHQSQNLIKGVSQNNTGTIFNETHFIGPIAYPIGFPLLLAPVIYFFGYDLVALNIYISLFMIFSCYLGFVFFRRNFSFLTSLFTTLIIAYNPIMLALKIEILSDLPYLLFSFLSLLLITGKESVFKSFLIGLVIALSVHIRSVGFILLLIYFIAVIQNYMKKNEKQGWKNMKPALAGLSTFLIVYFSLKFIFPCQTNYPFPFELENFWQNLNNHLSYNFESLFIFFKGNNSAPYGYLNIIASGTLIVYGISGMFISLKTGNNKLINYYVMSYIVVIACFKFGEAGFRFVLPILFFIFSYSIMGVYKTFENTFKFGKWFPVILGSLVLFSFKTDLIKIINTKHEITEGPEKPDIKKMIAFINSNLSANDIIEFEKPRVIALYTKAKAVAIKPVQSEAALKNDFQKFKVTYVLVHYILTDNPIRQFTQNPANHCVSVFKLNDIELFRVM